MELFEEALRLDPTYGAAWNNLGFLKETLAHRMDHRRSADTSSSSSSALPPSSTLSDEGMHPHRSPSMLLEEAEGHYRRAVKLNPRRHYTALNNLGKLLHAHPERSREQRAMGRNSEVREID